MQAVKNSEFYNERHEALLLGSGAIGLRSVPCPRWPWKDTSRRMDTDVALKVWQIYFRFLLGEGLKLLPPSILFFLQFLLCFVMLFRFIRNKMLYGL